MTEEADWKLKLRYGKLKTPFQHFTVLVDGLLAQQSTSSRAIMGVRIWAQDAEAAEEIVRDYATRVGFKPDGKSWVYDTEPEEPPSDQPSVYGCVFERYSGETPAEEPP
jgi:hypothetical protein